MSQNDPMATVLVPRFCHWVLLSDRLLVIRSDSFAQKHLTRLKKRLEKTEQALEKLSAKPFRDYCLLKNKVATILKQHRSEEYFKIIIETELITRQASPGRPNLKHPKPQITIEQFKFQFQARSVSIAEEKALCGWRIYVTNAPKERLSLSQAVTY